jgi:hypothetical protein
MDGKRNQRRLPKLLRKAVSESLRLTYKQRNMNQGFTPSEALIRYFLLYNYFLSRYFSRG